MRDGLRAFSPPSCRVSDCTQIASYSVQYNATKRPPGSAARDPRRHRPTRPPAPPWSDLASELLHRSRVLRDWRPAVWGGTCRDGIGPQCGVREPSPHSDQDRTMNMRDFMAVRLERMLETCFGGLDPMIGGATGEATRTDRCDHLHRPPAECLFPGPRRQAPPSQSTSTATPVVSPTKPGRRRFLAHPFGRGHE
jgi:hypothetical protein